MKCKAPNPANGQGLQQTAHNWLSYGSTNPIVRGTAGKPVDQMGRNLSKISEIGDRHIQNHSNIPTYTNIDLSL